LIHFQEELLSQQRLYTYPSTSFSLDSIHNFILRKSTEIALNLHTQWDLYGTFCFVPTEHDISHYFRMKLVAVFSSTLYCFASFRLRAPKPWMLTWFPSSLSLWVAWSAPRSGKEHQQIGEIPIWPCSTYEFVPAFWWPY
jgi:hypothetical protein